MSTPVTQPLSIEVTLPTHGAFGETDRWGERPVAERVTYRAHMVKRSGAPAALVVSVTALSAAHHNKSWFDGRFFVAEGFDASDPPEWVPPAPVWFWAEVARMSA